MRAALHRLVLFPPKPSTFSERAATRVIGGSRKVLDRLVDSGLVEAAGPGRYTIHQTIHDFLGLEPVSSKEIAEFVVHYRRLIAGNQKRYEVIEPEIDNMMNALTWTDRLGDYVGLVNSLVDLSPFLQAKGQYSTMYTFLRRAEELSLQENYKPGLCRVYRSLGISADMRRDADEAEFYLSSALALARELHDDWAVAHVLGNLAVFETGRNNYQKANEHIDEAIPLARSHQMWGLLSNLLSSKGTILLYHEDYIGARKLIKECIALAKRGGDAEALSVGLLNLSSLEFYEGRVAEGEKYAREGLAAGERIGSYFHLALALGIAARIAEDSGGTGKAIQLYERALENARKAKNPFLACEMLRALAWLERDANNPEQARIYATEALDLAMQFGNDDEKLDSLRLMGIVELARDASAAVKHLNKALALARGLQDGASVVLLLSDLASEGINAGDLASAELYLDEAKTPPLDAELRCVVSGAYDDLGRALETTGDHVKAEQCFLMGLSVARATKPSGDERAQHGGGAEHAHGQSHTRHRRKRASTQKVEQELLRMTGILLEDLGGLLESQGRYADAQQHFEEGLAIAREVADRTTEHRALFGLGNISLKLNKLDEAEETWRTMIQSAERVDTSAAEAGRFIGYGNFMLAQVAHTRGDKDAANELGQKALTILQSVPDIIDEQLSDVSMWLQSLENGSR